VGSYEQGIQISSNHTEDRDLSGMMVRQLFQLWLARQPALYSQALLLKGRGNWNLDKLAFLSLVHDKDIVFDVGANLGYYTLLFSYIAGSAGEIHSFEPVPDTFDALSASVRERDFWHNIRLNKVAIGESCFQAEIHLPGDDSGQASLARHTTGSWSESTTVTTYTTPVITLDDYVRNNALAKLDFLKIDIEGHELMCLKGAAGTLANLRPLLYIEICSDWSRDFGYYPPEIVKFLEEIGYESFYIVRDGIALLNDAKSQLAPERFAGSANLICSIASKHGRRLAALPRQLRV
jgi:FkbM family methyltransferase